MESTFNKKRKSLTNREIKAKKRTSLLLVAAMVLGLFAAIPQTVCAAAGDYNPGDIAIINGFIDNNGLKWTKAPADGSSYPGVGSGRWWVTWSSDATNKRIISLDF